ncbi:hypothetical protein ABIA31_006319 [Catenulispora sp. MAP5-51]
MITIEHPEPTRTRARPAHRLCSHQPVCPTADAPDREAARHVVSHPEQGWALLCNGVVIFDDTGELLPDGRVVAPHRLSTVSSPRVD